jgi:hypothetical protein
MTLYVPGPVLKYGDNEIVLFEIESTPSNNSSDLRRRGGGAGNMEEEEEEEEEEEDLMVEFVDKPDFWGPRGKGVWDGSNGERDEEEWYMRYERIVVGSGRDGVKGVAAEE